MKRLNFLKTIAGLIAGVFSAGAWVKPKPKLWADSTIDEIERDLTNGIQELLNSPKLSREEYQKAVMKETIKSIENLNESGFKTYHAKSVRIVVDGQELKGLNYDEIIRLDEYPGILENEDTHPGRKKRAFSKDGKRARNFYF